MQVGTLAVQHMFEKHVHYSVPLYQRPYVWSEADQWQPLWEDLRRIAEAVKEGVPARAHFMGASVQSLVPMPPGQIETRVVIDGQQRLTTLQLLLKAFHDIVAARGNEPYARAVDKLVRNDHPLTVRRQEKLKVWPTNANRDDFEAVMEATDRASLLNAFSVERRRRRINRSIPDAYLFFSESIGDWLADDAATAEGKIAALYSAVRDNVRLVVIDLDEKDDAQMIFETLNARGTPLLSADLVKNSLLSEVQADGGDVDDAYRRYWEKFDEDPQFWRQMSGRGHARRARIETFLQNALTLMSGSMVSANHLYADYRDFAGSAKSGRAIERLERFRTYGNIFKRLQDGHPNPRINAFFDRLRTLDVVTAWPFILALFERLEDVPEVVESILVDLESFLVRRLVCRLSTRSYGDVFADLTASLVEQPEDAQAAVRSFLLEGTAEADRWPTDEEFRHAWVGNPLYENLTRPRMLMLLEAMEAGLRSDFAETRTVPRNLTVEHIMPQGWREHWALGDGQTAEARDRTIHTIGNLTLLTHKFNAYQRNRPWVDGRNPEGGKRAALKEHSVLYLNKALEEFDQWNEETIADRSLRLFQIALKTWPRSVG